MVKEYTNKYISVVMPSFRLVGEIADNLKRVGDMLSSLGVRYELIPVDDGSGDGTDSVLEALRSDVICPVILKSNSGKGNALREGAKASRGDLILLLDADLDLSPSALPRFLEIMESENADVVIGSKRHKDSEIDYPRMRRFASSVYYTIVRILTGLPVTDTQTGMKLFKREALLYAFDRMLVKRYAFDVELLSIIHDAGYKVAEAPIKMEFGSKRGALTFGNVKTVLTDTLAIFYRLRVLGYYKSVEPVTLPEVPPTTSVIIACPSNSAYLEEAIGGIKTQTVLPLEVLVIPDEAFEKPTDWPDYVRILPSGKVRPAEKRNLGIKEAKGEIVAFLDDDAWPQPKWLENALAHFSRDDVGGVGGSAITPLTDSYLARMGGEVYASPLVSGTYRYRYIQERYRKVDDMPSCNLLVRTDILRKIGGYNTRYWPGEDTILCLDVVKTGKTIIYDPFATVWHHRRPLFGAHLRQLGRYAKHRGYFARVFPQTSLRISYMIPSLFVIGVVVGVPVIIFVPILKWVYFGVLGFYGLLTLLFSFHIKPLDWLVVWMGTILTHLWYGIRFIQGLIFGKMPKEVRDFDHGGNNCEQARN